MICKSKVQKTSRIEEGSYLTDSKKYRQIDLTDISLLVI